MPDKCCHACYDCLQPFNQLRRRHHCRLCGLVFCSKCAQFRVDGRALGRNGILRLCRHCFALSRQWITMKLGSDSQAVTAAFDSPGT